MSFRDKIEKKRKYKDVKIKYDEQEKEKIDCKKSEPNSLNYIFRVEDNSYIKCPKCGKKIYENYALFNYECSTCNLEITREDILNYNL